MKDSKIPKFRRCVLQNFPFIEEDFDALTDYELLCKVVQYLNMVIDKVNDLDRLEGEFAELKSYVDNYFANLDVQEEINAKLETMAESGQLAEVITAYLNSHAIIYFDTLNDLKESDYLIDGSIAITKGCTTINDGGSAKYLIREKTEEDVTDNYKVIAYGDTLVAEKIIGNETTPEQYGAIGDGNANDHDALLLCIGDGSAVKVFKKGATYKIATSLDISPYDNIVIKGNKAKIFCAEGCGCFYCYAWSRNIENITIEDLIIDGDRENATYQNTAASQFSCGNSKSIKNIHLINCEFNNHNRTAVGLYNDTGTRTATTYTKNNTIENCVFYNTSAVGVQSSNYSARILNCYFDDTGAEAITIDNGCEDYVVEGCRIVNYRGSAGAIGTDESKNVRIVNNEIDGTGNNAQYAPAVSINANTGLNINMVISNNNFINNKYGVAIGAYFIETYSKVVENIVIANNTFNSNTISDIVVYSYENGSKITIDSNSFGAPTYIDMRKTTNINNLHCDYGLPLTVTASTGFTLVKNNSKFANGILYLDAVVQQTDATFSGWKPVITMNINSGYKAMFEEQLNSSYEHVGFLDSQINEDKYLVYLPEGTSNYFIIKKQIVL